MEYVQVCEERKHKFASTGELTFKECPYCHTPMRLEADVEDWTNKLIKKFNSGNSRGISRGKLIDSLPRLPWFDDAVNDGLNDPDQGKSGIEWTKEDDEILLDKFCEVGIASHRVWDRIASDLGRSLYAIERQLRLVIAGKEVSSL
jgi:hypothetical protein